MLSFEKAKSPEKTSLKETLLISFTEASKQDYGNDHTLPPGVADGSQIDKALKEQTIYSIKADDKIIGGIILEEREDKENYLQTLWIHPNYQNQKIGHQALDFIEKTHSNAKSWILETPSMAARNIYFYEKNGYKKYEELSFKNSPVTLFLFRKEM